MEQDSLTIRNAAIRDQIMHQGVSVFESLFTMEQLADWNKRLDPLFAAKEAEYRTEINIGQLFDLEIFSEFFNIPMRALIRDCMPDATLLTFQCYESAGSQGHYTKQDSNIEWHRDTLTLPGLHDEDVHYLSIFVYLTPVDLRSGAFEIRPLPPQIPLTTSDPSIKVIGEIGTSFVWNRSFYHHQSINESPNRRRVLKISIQHNYLENSSVVSQEYARVREKIDANDEYLLFILGNMYQWSHRGKLLPNVVGEAAILHSQTTNARVDIRRFWQSPKKLNAKVRHLYHKHIRHKY